MLPMQRIYYHTIDTSRVAPDSTVEISVQELITRIQKKIKNKKTHGPHQCAEKYNASFLPANDARVTTVPSFLINSSPRLSSSVGGFHGKSAPCGSEEMAALPSFVMVSPFSSKMTNVGMPWTLNFLLSSSLRARSLKGRASQGISL